VYLPDVSAQGRVFPVGGRVVREVPGGPGDPAFAVAFDRLSERTAARLKDAVAAHLEGPAAMPAAGASRAAAPPAEVAAPAPDGSTGIYVGPASREVVRVPAEFAQGAAPLEPELPAELDPDRRLVPRRSYAGRRVVALGEEAARVLIGRDLSPGGMRVDPTPALQLGQRFRLALHVSQRETPLVVVAEVARDDGERGLVLRFHDVGEPGVRFLTKMIDALPVLETSNASAERVVVSEILEVEAE
jgi:hypothetical protein